MDLVAFFLGLHAATHAGDVSGSPAVSERWLGGLSDDQLRLRPGDGVNSIVWLLWHMARTEDVAVNLVVAARAQVLDGAWARRMRVPRRDMGTGMTSAEVAAYGVKAMNRGDVVAVPGFMNKAMAASVRFSPRPVIRRVVHRMQDAKT